MIRLLAVLSLSAAALNLAAQIAGPQKCAACHSAIAATQAGTAMAKTWQGLMPAAFPDTFNLTKKEGPAPDLNYEVRRVQNHLQFRTSTPDGAAVSVPVEAVVGGNRHGLSFLVRVSEIGGVALQRPALVEARYAYSTPHRDLSLSPGFDSEKPSNVEDTLGRTLSPAFERKCLSCHGQPNTLGAGTQGGVRCESCHGSGLAHVNSLQSPGQMVKPAVPKGEAQLEVCGQCHTGLSDQSDALPDDLLVSNQVPALRNSECFRQSGHAVTCSDCHDPHQDSTKVEARTVATCLGCHSGKTEQHAAICPVNATAGCVGCHMPTVEKNTFLLTDHWIRLHPEQNASGAVAKTAERSLVTPKHEYLRLIATGDRATADAALARVTQGEAFAQVARQVSSDDSAPGGGYIGDIELSQIDSKLAAAAAALQPGAVSPVVDAGSRFLILYRMPRDFKWQAEQLFLQASALKAKGDLKGAAEKDQQALDVYPHFLRALVLMGTTLAQAGDVARASAVLQFATQFYPKDASAMFDYALTQAKDPAQQIEALQHALELDPDMTAAYESLGAALFSGGQRETAISIFRKGLEVDPLSASLNYNLSLALAESGDASAARSLMTLAQKLDRNVTTHRAGVSSPAH